MTLKTNVQGKAALPLGLHVLPMDVAIEKLRTLKQIGVDETDRPQALLSRQIDTLENVFQARTGQLNEAHIGELEAAIRTHGTLEPVIMWRCGAYALLLEGHHRLEAYQRTEQQTQKPISIPVTWFEGSVEAAIVRASSANTRAKLPMAKAEKLDHAWRLVLSGAFSVKEVIDASSISRRTIMTMRSVRNKLGDDAKRCASWRAALAQAHGLGGDWSEDEEDAKIEALAKEYADRLAKEFSTKLSHVPVITARAFRIHFNRASHEVISAWQQEVGSPVEDDDDDE
ncbi:MULTISPECIES: ParB N-terminal domain-containing protein [unclassified Ensifer]|uniref:ParB N-terminal domain-containing protein n=1 Tax=unclassified Ensifer TaxID=2633371 RepID=UPI0008136D69|nr:MULTISPECIES: ParB N-terminal domain-containing protein [unclassified Ensifer]OCP20978.1 hypothetical protein BC363_29235 [Ensifer sp. LC384]OCP21219.1 hypothetical protein BC361_27155 [Ensifer sp. LC54]